MNEQSPAQDSCGLKMVYLCLLLILIPLFTQAWMQLMGIRQGLQATTQGLEQSKKALEAGENTRKFAEVFFKDLVSMAPSNTNAARIQKQYNIQYKGEAPVASPSPVQTPSAAPASPPSGKK